MFVMAKNTPRLASAACRDLQILWNYLAVAELSGFVDKLLCSLGSHAVRGVEIEPDVLSVVYGYMAVGYARPDPRNARRPLSKRDVVEFTTP